MLLFYYCERRTRTKIWWQEFYHFVLLKDLKKKYAITLDIKTKMKIIEIREGKFIKYKLELQ